MTPSQKAMNDIISDFMPKKKGLVILSWALYDLANQFFALNIISLYFVRWLVLVKGIPEIFYSIAFAASVFLIAIMAPVLGAVSDQAQRHRLFLTTFTLISVFFTMALGFVENVFMALVFFVLANWGCQMASVFYNALIVNIAPVGKIGLTSGLGRMFGYSGAAVSLLLIRPFVIHFGYHETFFPTGALFLVFALPCMIFVKDHNPQKLDMGKIFNRRNIVDTFRATKNTFFGNYQHTAVFFFLKSIFFSLAAVNAIVLFMSVYATQVFKLDDMQIISLIGFSVIFAIAGSFLSGWFSDKIGHRRALFIIYSLWILCFIGGGLASNMFIYYIIGILVGLALGAIWVVVRALGVSLVPQEKVGEMFGLFNLVGYVASVVGALFWGFILLICSPLGILKYRIALLSLSLFMVLGIYFLVKVPPQIRENNEKQSSH